MSESATASNGFLIEQPWQPEVPQDSPGLAVVEAVERQIYQDLEIVLASGTGREDQAAISDVNDSGEAHDPRQSVSALLDNVREAFREPTTYGISAPNIAGHFEGTDEQMPRIFRQWKGSAKTRLGRPMPWTQWLSRRPDEANGVAGATDEQLLNMLQWSVHRLRVHNESPDTQTRISAAREQAIRLTEKAADNGRLAPELQVRFEERFAVVPIVVGDVFDEMLLGSTLGYHSFDTGLITMRASALEDKATVVHEGLHDTGGFLHELIDEPTTEEITRTACEQDPTVATPGDELVYTHQRDVLGMINSLAGVTLQELSRLYVSTEFVPSDGIEWKQIRVEACARNQENFRQLIEARYGGDLLGIILEAYDNELLDIASAVERRAATNNPESHRDYAVGHVQNILDHLEEQGEVFDKDTSPEDDPSGEKRRAHNQQALARVQQRLGELRALPWESPDRGVFSIQ